MVVFHHSETKQSSLDRVHTDHKIPGKSWYLTNSFPSLKSCRFLYSVNMESLSHKKSKLLRKSMDHFNVMCKKKTETLLNL